MSLKLKLLLYTGGTIGMSKDFETGALKALISISYCKNSELKQLDCEIETLSLKTP
jgi:L-asparaginase